MSRELCARCRAKPMNHPFLGCLCDDCETAIEDMTQAELDADQAAHDALRAQKEQP